MPAPPPDPLSLFHTWQGEAKVPRTLTRPVHWVLRQVVGELPDADAATLATATADGAPSARMVIVKAASAEGFVFYTNLTSRKATELSDNPRAALVFHWPAPPRQVRVEGRVERLTPAEDQAYWSSRPRGSQIGAMASRQSQPIDGHAELMQRAAALEQQWGERPIPCPEYWGGFRLVPRLIEFWQGRMDRLHHRYCYRRSSDNTPSWELTWLAP